MRDALFMGRLTAQATHDMQNILATIRESAGLMEDLLAMGGGDFPHAERFKRGLAVLGEQVERGMVLSEQLNYCAHAPEQSPAGCEMNDMLRSVSVLYQRIAARHRVSLGLCTGRTGMRADLRAVEGMKLVGLALDCALPLLPRDATLTLSAAESGGLPEVRLGGVNGQDGPEHAAMAAQPEYAELAMNAKALGVGLRPGEGGRGLALAFPAARA